MTQALRPVAADAGISIYVFGPMRILDSGEAIPLPSRSRVREILGLLLVTRSPLSRRTLAGMIWPDRESDALATLRPNISHLRTYLNALEGRVDGAAEWLDLSSEVVAARPEHLPWLDLSEFEVGEAASHDGDASLESLEQSVLLSAEPLLVGVDADWAVSMREDLRVRHERMVERLVRVLVAEGERTRAEQAVERMLQSDPNSELGAWLQIWTAWQFGKRDRALDAYAAYRERLNDVPGLPPDPSIDALIGEIVSGDESVQPPGTSEQGATASSDEGVPVYQLPRVDDLDRRHDVEQLLQSGRLVTITGPTGIGKTRLASAVAEQEERRALNSVRWRQLGDGNSRIGVDAWAPAIDADCKLLVIDGHDIDDPAVARFIQGCLQDKPELRVLMVGRCSLRLDSERIYRVPPLGTEHAEGEAASLFASRLAGRGGRPPTSGDVLKICRQLHGSPLAIEWAAACAVDLPPATILSTLFDHRPSEVVDLPITEGEHDTLVEWLDAGLGQISDDERRLIRRLAHADEAFSATDVRKAALALGLDEAAADAWVEELVDSSILLVDINAASAQRYRLPRPLKDYLGAAHER